MLFRSEMIERANTIAAYDSTGTELTDPPKLEYDMVYGKASANFFEVSEQNNEKAIDLRPWLTAGETGVAPVVKIKTSFKIIYTHSGIVTQFPERQNSAESTDVGTYVSARSSLAYDAAHYVFYESISRVSPAQISGNRGIVVFDKYLRIAAVKATIARFIRIFARVILRAAECRSVEIILIYLSRHHRHIDVINYI